MFCRVLIAIVFAFFFVLPGFAQDGGSDDVDAVTSEFNEGPAPNADSSNKELAQLGERLFFDPHLSGSGRTACASCHNPDFAFSQPERTSTFDSGRPGPRNAPSVLTAPFMPRLMWDGRFRSLEEQVYGPLSVRGEMGIDIQDAAARLRTEPSYLQQFTSIFGEPPTPAAIASAIATFERSLVSRWSAFDKFSLKGDRGAMTDFERFGFELFTGKARCVICHKLPGRGTEGYALFTDFRFHNLGVGFYRGRFADPGWGAITGRLRDTGAFRTPSLRNVAVTAPYMHDGSLPTLRAVIEFYNEGGQRNPYQTPLLRPLGLSEEEKEALVAFLKSLTTEDFGRRLSLAEPVGTPFDRRD